MKARLFLSLLGIIAMVLVSCSSSTPQSRIREHPELYSALNASDQNLVYSGQIRQGMTPAAVYLAWGQPEWQAEGLLNNISSMRWGYTALEPVVSTSVGFGFGSGWGPYRGSGWYGGPGVYNDITYVPVNAGFVLFQNGKVTAWEHRR